MNPSVEITQERFEGLKEKIETHKSVLVPNEKLCPQAFSSAYPSAVRVCFTGCAMASTNIYNREEYTSKIFFYCHLSGRDIVVCKAIVKEENE